MIDAHPLTWPAGWPRTNSPKRSSFGKYTFEQSRRDVLRQLRLLRASDIIISSNLKLRQDGWPYSNQRQPDDAGIAVYFKLNGEDQCIPCDKWWTVEENLRAISKTIDAIRGLERWGAKEMVNAAFRGFKALPASGDSTPSNQRNWFDVLEVSPNASWDVIEAAYRKLLHKVHPDKGGSVTAFYELQDAFKQAKELRQNV
jgi:hypothetical protein